MDHSCIDCCRDRTVYFVRIQESVEDFAAGADFSADIVDIRKSRIAHMMIDADGFCRMVKSISRNCQAVTRADIAGNEQIKFSALFYFCFDIIDMIDMSKDRLRMVEIYAYIHIRKISSDIQIQSHTGTDTVTIRSDMTTNSYCFHAFQHF